MRVLVKVGVRSVWLVGWGVWFTSSSKARLETNVGRTRVETHSAQSDANAKKEEGSGGTGLKTLSQRERGDLL